MHSSSLLLSLLSAVSALALPTSNILPRSSGSSNGISNIALPTSTLAAPDASLVLRYVALGLGTQNYTCASTPGSTTAAPASVGAKADLYDATPILGKGDASTSGGMERVLPGLALQLFESMNITPEQFPDQLKMDHIGNHFFAAGLVPTFVLSGAKPKAQIQGKKVGDIAAPAGACPGADGEGAIDWLQLIDNGLGFSTGTPLQGGDVYRVETAGGLAPKTCANNTGELQVHYATLYFFFGPGQ